MLTLSRVAIANAAILPSELYQSRACNIAKLSKCLSWMCWGYWFKYKKGDCYCNKQPKLWSVKHGDW